MTVSPSILRTPRPLVASIAYRAGSTVRFSAAIDPSSDLPGDKVEISHVAEKMGDLLQQKELEKQQYQAEARERCLNTVQIENDLVNKHSWTGLDLLQLVHELPSKQGSQNPWISITDLNKVKLRT